MKLSKKLMGFVFCLLVCLVFYAVAFAAETVTPGIDWKAIFGPGLTEIVKGLGTVIGLMIIFLLKLLYQKNSHNLIATKILDFLVSKAIKNELENPVLTGSEKWQKLTADAEKIGIDSKAVNSLEAQVMAQVNAFAISRNVPNALPPSLRPKRITAFLAHTTIGNISRDIQRAGFSLKAGE